jgi:transcriptional regulator with XRE-family HTH domain
MVCDLIDKTSTPTLNEVSMAKKGEKTREGFAQRLRKARNQKDLSQQELAKIIGIHVNQISRYEQGLSQPTVDKIHKLADALDTSGDYLIAGETTNAARANFEDKELLQLFQKAATLSAADKATLKRLVNALVNQEKLEAMASQD